MHVEIWVCIPDSQSSAIKKSTDNHPVTECFYTDSQDWLGLNMQSQWAELLCVAGVCLPQTIKVLCPRETFLYKKYGKVIQEEP